MEKGASAKSFLALFLCPSYFSLLVTIATDQILLSINKFFIMFLVSLSTDHFYLPPAITHPTHVHNNAGWLFSISIVWIKIQLQDLWHQKDSVDATVTSSFSGCL